MTSPEQSNGLPSTDLDQIEADITRHREELSKTMEELTGRVNVKPRAHRRTEETKQRALAEVDRSRRRLQSADPAEAAGAAAPVLAAIAVLAVIVSWMRRRR